MAGLIFFVSFVTDWIVGDPQRWPHPVRFIGQLIIKAESLARRWAGDNPARLRLAGVFLGLGVVFTTMGVVALVLTLASVFGFLVWFLVACYFVYSSLCLKDLYYQTWQVEKALKGGYLDEARRLLSWVVGRDTANLDEAAIRRALIETLAENLSDGVVAPLFYLALGGPVLAWGYKAVNTLDSMVGYKNEKYLHLGRFSARLDDAANYIPARLTALLLVVAARLLGYDWRRALVISRRDGRLHASPNSAHPEAAMAGALGLWLGGSSYYGGVLSEKPRIYAEGAEAAASDMRSAENMMIGAAILMAVLVGLTLFLVTGGWGWLR